jgi:catechol 2,3-dioxygenase-like lactoylglutathione lyase family enzyme
MIAALDRIEVITLFVADAAASRAFYTRVFGLEPIYDDAVSSVLAFGGTMLNLLQSSEAPALVTPAAVAPAARGAALLFTIRVADADAVCAELARHGVPLLNGPVDRPWGRRTAAFADPDGHVWEIAQELAST